MKVHLDNIRQAAIDLAKTSEKKRNAFLGALAKELRTRKKDLLAANQKDVADAQRNELPEAFVQRLVVDAHGLETLNKKLRDVQKLKSGLGEIIEHKKDRTGLVLDKVRTPLGVILIIYESRPEVTIDVAALCIKSGNVAILKGGSEAKHSNQALYHCIQNALKKSGFAKDTVSYVQDRSAVSKLLKQHTHIDLVIARGGYSLVKAVLSDSTIPVLAHAAGGARIYIDQSADLKMAEKILVNAKISKPAACNSLDTIVVHKKIASRFIPRITDMLRARGVRVLGDALSRKFSAVGTMTEKDWDTEFLGPTVGIKVVSDVAEAITFINHHSKRHSEGIVASNKKIIRQFTDSVDAAAIFVNASTRLHDGYVFGLGSEMGIAAGKLHARGPVGLKELTTYKWQIYGKGHIRA
ncbi:glutamate-5-semialdehyde dehydrogenase [Candidatus Kaiserbacteria bacterium RIFCSPLOWO2_12_FULL_53_8]|uniref:Gamma-glutamyl phosphate reductase n=2 Tax=Candidatus Kaiseribacteriota TaxID=1752734 RepID=A0A1F6CT92_9BACT|nr:MAG: glutamate-5-semialdehyde dehydrogenase [Candidatus Kaiserbacteria bacterium RIFCSPHIGHO2_01_FULL_53_29]OGG91037.1 MAG: glutamate-5-semialdehyde dehydrogenase [Candidatus Kaiserbacteria bacterium RIFCSPLOWO2_12_FULL_53_8]